MYEPKAKTILRNIIKLRYATMYNFSAFTVKTSNSLRGSMQEPRRLFAQLKKSDFIRPIENYGYGRQFSYNTFYRATKLGYEAMERKYLYSQPKSFSMLQHESAKIDVLLGFLYLYPDYDIEIDYNLNMEIKKGDVYNPDAYIKMISPDDKVYEFIIEIERSRDWPEIRKEKLNRNENLKPLDLYGLSNPTKFLYIYCGNFEPFIRPVDYPNYKIEIERLNRKFKRFKKFTYNLKDRYLFTPITNFTRLNEAVWLDIKGNPRKLIQ